MPLVDKSWHKDHIDSDFKIGGANCKFLYSRDQNDSNPKIKGTTKYFSQKRTKKIQI